MSSNVQTLVRDKPQLSETERPGRSDVEAAVRTMIRWTGDNPDREGLRETPSRVARAFEEFCAACLELAPRPEARHRPSTEADAE